MTILHPTVPANVEATLVKWFTDEFANYELPVYLPSYTVVSNWPDIPASLPCFSFAHFPVGSTDRYQGRVETDETNVVFCTAMFEVSAWVNRQQLYNNADIWQARLSFMHSMIMQTWQQTPRVPILDFITAPGETLFTGYLISLDKPSTMQTAKEKNVAIERRRVLITYHWHQRTLIT